MTISYIQVAGKSDIYIGFPSDAYATLLKIGEQLDDTRLEFENVFHDVLGDANGGPQGRPIERQFLGASVRGQLSLSKWSPEAYRRILAHNVMATDGKVLDSEIGALILRDRSFRVVIAPSRSNIIGADLQGEGKDAFFYNFPCCCVSSPVNCGQGTKFSLLSFSFEAFRMPEGHPMEGTEGANVGTIWNRDSTNVPGWTNGAHTVPEV